MIRLLVLSFVSQKMCLEQQGQIIKSKFDFMISLWPSGCKAQVQQCRIYALQLGPFGVRLNAVRAIVGFSTASGRIHAHEIDSDPLWVDVGFDLGSLLCLASVRR